MMATRTRSMIQDENMNIHFRGASIGRDTNVLKAKKATGRGGLKPLTNITNSGKPSGQAVKKNQNNKLNGILVEQGLQNNQECVNPQASILFQNENSIPHSKGNSIGGKSLASDVQKKAGLGGNRRALTNITNSRKLSLHQESKKTFPKKLNDIAEEQCLHNHNECIKSQTKGMDMQLFLKTLGFDDDFSIPFGTPSIRPTSRASKIDTSSPVKHLEYEETPELLNEDDRSPPRCRTPMVKSPSQSHYPSSPTLMLLGTP